MRMNDMGGLMSVLIREITLEDAEGYNTYRRQFDVVGEPRSGSQSRKTRLRCVGARNIIQPIDDA